MALVPDNFSFSLEDIYYVTGYSDLANSFTYSIYDYRDFNYWGVETGMKQFRNYGPKYYFELDKSVLYFDEHGNPCDPSTVYISTDTSWYTYVDDSEIPYSYVSPSSYNGSTYCYWHCGSDNQDSFYHAGQINFYKTDDNTFLGSVGIVQYAQNQGCY